MILEKQTEANILTEGQSQESIGMSLDLDSAQVLMQMLSKNLYSDDIGSTIRECASNALDSHRRAGVDTPIIVSFKSSTDYNYEFCVDRHGCGSQSERIQQRRRERADHRRSGRQNRHFYPRCRDRSNAYH